jgi:hypothetical protein
MIDQDLVHEALQRWARTPDGRVFYVGLQKVLMGVPSDKSDGALRENLGRRRFVSELMAVMAKVMTENLSDDGIGSGDRPIVFQLKQSARVAGKRGARRRVSPGADAAADAE